MTAPETGPVCRVSSFLRPTHGIPVRAPWRTAFSVLETLVVVAILALVAAVGVVSLSGSTRRARVDSALHTLALGDAAARTAALSGRPVVLTIDGDRGTVSVRPRGDSGPGWVRQLPSGVSCTLALLAGDPLPGLDFDATGRCLDYERRAVSEGNGRENVVAARVRVSGITGWTEAAVEQAP